VKRPFLTLLALAALLLPASAAPAKTVRIFVIGNSFSNNALLYLPRIAGSAGDQIVVKTASIGGSSLERHWNGVAASLSDSDARGGKIYGGKSLKELMGDADWDIVTIQQYSMDSPNPETYQPFAARLRDYVLKLKPRARVVLHQTWAYRVDSRDWGFVARGKPAKDQAEMWASSREAYHRVADEMGLRLIPVGDAFRAIDADTRWGYKPDPTFDPKAAKEPALPDQAHSLHVGYYWKDGKLGFDSHHASPAGCYLAGLIWYAALFDSSPGKVTFVPPGVSPDFAARLREVAAEVVQADKATRSRPAALAPLRPDRLLGDHPLDSGCLGGHPLKPVGDGGQLAVAGVQQGRERVAGGLELDAGIGQRVLDFVGHARSSQGYARFQGTIGGRH
jgi:hypothetical protein